MALVYILRQYRGNVLMQMVLMMTASRPHANVNLAVRFVDVEIGNREPQNFAKRSLSIRVTAIIVSLGKVTLIRSMAAV